MTINQKCTKHSHKEVIKKISGLRIQCQTHNKSHRLPLLTPQTQGHVQTLHFGFITLNTDEGHK